MGQLCLGQGKRKALRHSGGPLIPLGFPGLWREGEGRKVSAAASALNKPLLSGSERWLLRAPTSDPLVPSAASAAVASWVLGAEMLLRDLLCAAYLVFSQFPRSVKHPAFSCRRQEACCPPAGPLWTECVCLWLV